MKRTLLITTLSSCLLLSNVALSDTSNVTTTATANPTAGSTAGVDNSQHNSGNVAASDLSKSVPGAYAPSLSTTLTETCMGSTSGGVGFAGGSVSLGTTWSDDNCVNRLNAREIHSYGDAVLAKEIMCENEVVRKAAIRVGRPCMVDGGTAGKTVIATSQPVDAAGLKELEAAARQDTLRKADEAREAMRLKGYE